MDQQCQAETFHGIRTMLLTKQNIATGLDYCLFFASFFFLVFALNPQQDLSINLLSILMGTGLLHFWAWVSGGVYRSWCLDALEGSFALNLIILAGATFYVNHSHENQFAVGYTSVSIAFATFVGILAFQLANVAGIIEYLKTKCPAIAMRNTNQAEAEPKSPTGSLPDQADKPRGV